MRALLDTAAQADRDCGAVDALANRKFGQIDRKIADLTALRRELAGMISNCPGGTIADCRIHGAFSPSA